MGVRLNRSLHDLPPRHRVRWIHKLNGFSIGSMKELLNTEKFGLYYMFSPCLEWIEAWQFKAADCSLITRTKSNQCPLQLVHTKVSNVVQIVRQRRVVLTSGNILLKSV
eukprot:GILI01049064.1.p2 GENE.GILI01049064.1~~GILI01049064.1.p2  ORF type:complete len:109 (+),score=0.01 GILI01049064.1:323-649(+)